MTEIIRLLIEGSAMAERDLRAIIRNAPNRYKTYPISKRNGGRRLISQPAKEVKLLQRILIDGLLSRLEVHESAMAYRSNRSIADNAKVHAPNGPILKYDFKDFFPSLKATDWRIYCKNNNLFEDEDDVYITTKLFFHTPPRSTTLRLAIGAPSSPMLSNILMYNFDQSISSSLASHQVKYTRYADDLTFSAPRTGFLNSVEKTLRGILIDLQSPKLQLNHSKTVLATKKYRRSVTGLVLTNEGQISLGHERKKKIRAGVHYFIQNRLNTEQENHLRGLIAFAISIEPDFIDRLKSKFGSQTIFTLLNRQRSA